MKVVPHGPFCACLMCKCAVLCWSKYKQLYSACTVTLAPQVPCPKACYRPCFIRQAKFFQWTIWSCTAYNRIYSRPGEAIRSRKYVFFFFFLEGTRVIKHVKSNPNSKMYRSISTISVHPMNNECFTGRENSCCSQMFALTIKWMIQIYIRNNKEEIAWSNLFNLSGGPGPAIAPNGLSNCWDVTYLLTTCPNGYHLIMF